MKKFLVLLIHFALCIVHCAFSQAPTLKMWDYRYGGTQNEDFMGLQITSDGGFIICGSTLSNISGNKTTPRWGNYDFWIVKTDPAGVKQWESDFGGIDHDFPIIILETNDGGYLVAGYSNSGISGNKTQPVVGGFDYWIVKMDASGNFLWDKDYGGTANDFLLSAEKTDDGGYILGGISSSGLGGDKSQPTWGNEDYWIIKIDSAGNKQWDQDFGGTETEYFGNAIQTNDGGYLIAGHSESGISGNKTQPTWGGIDYWVIKTDSNGIKIWDADYGGADWEYLSNVIQTPGGNYLLCGWSTSGISGNKSQPSWGYGDYWIVKINPSGILLWEKAFGGTNYEEHNRTIVTPDGGLLHSGDSYSPVSGDKSEADLGLEQTWIVKTDSSGNFEWDKTVFSPGHDEFGKTAYTSEGCIVIANGSNGTIGGYKSENAWPGGADFWILKLCDSLSLQPQALFISENHICPGTCTEFTNLSLNGVSFQWIFQGGNPSSSTDINPTGICYNTPGTYNVTLITSNGYGTDTASLNNYITVYPFPPPQGILQNGDTLFANQGAASYHWYFNGSIINGATNYFYIATSSGDYNVVATDVNGCEVEAVVNNVLASAQLAVASLQFAIFPNPVTDKFTIQKLALSLSKGPSGSAVELSIYNMMGEKIIDASPLSFGEGPGGEAMWTIDCRPLPSGLYYIEINANNKIFRSKFVKSTYR